MAKAWRIIIAFVLIAAIIGTVFLMVGLMTGADFNRIFHTVADRYGLVDDPAVYEEYFAELAKSVLDCLPLETLADAGILIN